MKEIGLASALCQMNKYRPSNIWHLVGLQCRLSMHQSLHPVTSPQACGSYMQEALWTYLCQDINEAGLTFSQYYTRCMHRYNVDMGIENWSASPGQAPCFSTSVIISSLSLHRDRASFHEFIWPTTKLRCHIADAARLSSNASALRFHSTGRNMFADEASVPNNHF